MLTKEVFRVAIGAVLLMFLGCNPDPRPEPDGDSVGDGSIVVPEGEDCGERSGCLTPNCEVVDGCETDLECQAVSEDWFCGEAQNDPDSPNAGTTRTCLMRCSADAHCSDVYGGHSRCWGLIRDGVGQGCPDDRCYCRQGLPPS